MGMIFFGAAMLSVAIGAKLTPVDGFIVFGVICMIVGTVKSLCGLIKSLDE